MNSDIFDLRRLSVTVCNVWRGISAVVSAAHPNLGGRYSELALDESAILSQGHCGPSAGHVELHKDGGDVILDSSW